MAKYKITYACGHIAEVQLYGKEAEREKKIKWYSTINCPVCEAREQKEKAEAAGLPHLTGSEKQIAWATKLRNNALAVLDSRLPLLPDKNQTVLKSCIKEWVEKETASTYWIDNRFDLEYPEEIAELINKSVNYKKYM